MWNRHKGANQKWKIVYVDTVTDQTKGLDKDFGLYVNKPFYIRSRLPSRRMVECIGNYVYQTRWKSGNTSQQWFFDPKTKTIRNKRNQNWSLEITENKQNGGPMRCRQTNSRWYQLFKYDNSQLLNIKYNNAMEVRDNHDLEKQQLHLNRRNNKLNQQWDIVYVPDFKGEPKKGELNEDYGFYVERPFHIISQLPRRRYVQRLPDGGSQEIAIKQPNGYDSQVWYFDQKTLSIKNK